MIDVPKLMDVIPKKVLFQKLEKEAPDFLTEILNIELPPTEGRLNLPVIETEIKRQVERANRTLLEIFLEERTYHIEGELIKFSEFYDAFYEWLEDKDRYYWTKIRVGKELPPKFPKGRVSSESGQFFIGNLSFEPMTPGTDIKSKYVLRGDKLVEVT
jgi:hypothetical protein